VKVNSLRELQSAVGAPEGMLREGIAPKADVVTVRAATIGRGVQR
jgi:hypothetical protein